MALSIFVDGSGGPEAGFGFFVKETGESSYKKEANITNNQAEYMAIISVLKKFQGSTDELVIYSDSKNTVSQLNHEYAINNSQLRTLAITSNILKGYTGKIFPISPTRETVFDKKAYKSVLDVNEEIDLAVIVTKNDVVPAVLEECGKKGIKGAIVITAGFKEVNEEGAQ